MFFCSLPLVGSTFWKSVLADFDIRVEFSVKSCVFVRLASPGGPKLGFEMMKIRRCVVYSSQTRLGPPAQGFAIAVRSPSQYCFTGAAVCREGAKGPSEGMSLPVRSCAVVRLRTGGGRPWVGNDIRWPSSCAAHWLVYLLFPGSREKLQGRFLEGFEIIFGQFSVNFPDGMFGINNCKSV